MFWRNYFCNNYKRITLQSKFLGLFLVKRDLPVAATLQRKSSGGIIFVIITKIITKEIVPRTYFIMISGGYIPPPLGENGGHGHFDPVPSMGGEQKSRAVGVGSLVGRPLSSGESRRPCSPRGF